MSVEREEHLRWFMDIPDPHARWVLFLLTLPEDLREEFSEQVEREQLYCTAYGVRYRVVGVDRMGNLLVRYIGIIGRDPIPIYMDDVEEWGNKP